MCIISAIGIVILAFFSIVFLRKSLSPISAIVELAERMGQGQLRNMPKTNLSARDEVGKLSDIFNHTTSVLEGYISEISYILNHLSTGNLDIQIEREYAGDFAQIREALLYIIESLNETMSEIMLASEQVNLGATQISQGSQSLSDATVTQANSIESIVSSIQKVSEEIKYNAENAKHANLISQQANLVMMKEKEQMRDMLEAMGQILKTSNEIKKIIKGIDDIAFQTNILAVNAAVEAAHAGETGKGFAVVANEVRSLAQKSARAAKETEEMIEKSLVIVKNGTDVANQTAKTLMEFLDQTTHVHTAIEEISLASERQEQEIESVVSRIEEISAAIHTNSATAEESAAGSQELSAQAQILKCLVEKFKLKKQDDVY